jgi:Flp pilus assembly protein TadG
MKLRKNALRGSATLELSLLLPILVTSAMLAMDYGRFATQLIAVNNAVRAGAYMGSFNPPDTNEILWDNAVRQAIIDELTANVWFDPNQLTIADPQNIYEAGTRRVQVQASYPFQTVAGWTYLPGYTNQRNLSHTAVMRAIR